MLSKIKPILRREYFLVFLGTSIVSFILFLLLTLLFSYSRFLFFNYFLKEAVNYAVLTFIIIVTFSLFLGFMASFIMHHFKTIMKKKVFVFLGITGVFFIVSYILMLGKTSYSLFSYTEMNGFFYTLINFLLLTPILALSSFLIINAYITIKNIKSGISGVGGLFLGAVSMGCPTCGALLLSLFGITSGLAIFPLKGVGVKIFSIGLLGLSSYKLKKSETCLSCVAKNNLETNFFSQKFENIILGAIILTAGLILFNQVQVSALSSSLDSLAGTASRVSPFIKSGSGGADLSGVDVYSVTSTAMAVATVFPELQNMQNEDDIINFMISTGTPEYSKALGGISFDDPANSIAYLGKWYYSLKEEVKNNDPATWKRYLNLAAAPRGISCEFCCGVGPQGITKDGQLRCGCKHNSAAQALTLGLMQSTDYSDAQILREVMKWKTMFFPKNMVGVAMQVAGTDPSQLKDLPGMVGGC